MERTLSVLTFNLRMDAPWDGINAFPNRTGLIRSCIGNVCPELIGFQEVLPHMKQWLTDNLPEYLILGVGRDARYGDETTAIAVRRSALDVMAMDTFWLSGTPDVPGSRYQTDQSICPRICTWVLLADRRTAKQVYLFNTHLDHEGSCARVQGIRQILAEMEKACGRRNAPVILTGDFNDTPDSETVRLCESFSGCGGTLTDAAAGYGVGATYHGYHPETARDRIDYIFTNLPVLSCRTLTEEKNGVFLSDHYPMLAKLRF